MDPDQQLTLDSACRRLVVLRSLVIAVLAMATAVVYLDLAIRLPLAPMAGAVLALALLNILVCRPLRAGVPITRGVILAQLLVDVAVLTSLLYFAGGSSNPFVTFYLLPLVITAIVLPRTHTAIMAAATIGCYSALMVWHVPLPARLDRFQLHVIGMWCNFVLSAGLVVFFVAHMASALRTLERKLAKSRERALRNEHIVALGTLAAGTAHELATPLSTMAVITREMETVGNLDPEQSNNVACLREQIEACKTTLGRLRNYSIERHHQAEAGDAWMRRLVEQWRLLRPATPLTYHWVGHQPAPSVRCDDELSRTVTNLINNAADASPAGVTMEGYATDHELVIEIQDAGDGIAADIASRARKPGATSKRAGHGLGLMLAHATVDRLGGRLQWFDRAEGGIRTHLALPLSTLGPA